MSLNDITVSYAQSPEVQVARLEMMLEVSRSLNSTLDLDMLLQSIMDVATELTDTEAASVLLIDRKTGELYFEAATGDKETEVERIPVPLDGSAAGWIAQNGEVLVIDNAQEDNRHFGGVDQRTHFVTRNILGVPLKVKQTIIGVLEVINKNQNSNFTSDDIYIINTLAAQAAVAIENARLFRQSDELANVVHELRSPLASIIGYSQLLLMQSTVPAEKLERGLTSINQEASRLSQLVDDFLDLTRMETGRIRMEQEPVDLQVLAHRVIEQLYPQARAKGISLSMNVVEAIPDIQGDRNRLKQVILNLVDNAIKYNRHEGSVDISLSSNTVRVQLSVRNTGHGIAPDNLDLVFDKFYRTEDDELDVKGTGLGLPIAKKIIEAHDGDIWVESEVGVGCNFAFSLPLHNNGV